MTDDRMTPTKADDLRQAMIAPLQKTLTFYARFRGDLYEAITDDDISAGEVRTMLRLMIAELCEADDEALLRAEEVAAIREQRRQEEFENAVG